MPIVPSFVTFGRAENGEDREGSFCVKLINAPINRDENCRMRGEERKPRKKRRKRK